ncbi:hypothetical protein GF386_05275 [Candidatus Pacearchaeota archaeon]|nr:hypothetical protein [Candidatus Pacearchaeota archaeon]
MFECTATGNNENYGKEGEKILLADNNVIYAIKKGWITEKIKYAGVVCYD